jgi:hypothetical protein
VPIYGLLLGLLRPVADENLVNLGRVLFNLAHDFLL